MAHDLIKKKVIFVRPLASTYTATPVEFPIGINQAVSLIAIHWHIETIHSPSTDALVVCALSENPEHELNPPTGVAEFQGDPDLYGMATFLTSWTHSGTEGQSQTSFGTLVIPLYGMLRPKRQVAVFANIWGVTIGIRGEIYYEPEIPSREIVNAINRRYGKYRRA